MPDDNRPNPEALLEAVRRESRGKLKIFLGAAPGVGKTYEMLQAAQRKHAEGVEIVVGVVETHGRAETQALIDGLEVLPRRTIEYKGRTLDELDLDALLKRHPQLALVDELAHANAPGSRHPKRYLDVVELLDAGIDVYSTLNVQHVESLNDVVAKITRVRVRETVPDSIIDLADEIEVVDTTPGELIQRLNEGKVYVRAQAERALKHFFQPGNLAALRELALRRTAQRVDAEMLDYMRQHAIEGPWAAGERVLACLDPSPQALDVVRAARRTADQLRAPLLALYVENERHAVLNETERAQLIEAERLAERLGAEVHVVPGRAIDEEVLAFCRQNNVTRVVIGKSQRSRLFELRHGSVVDRLVRNAGGIAIEIAPSGTPSTTPPATSRPRRAIDPWALLEGAVMVALAAAAGIGIHSVVPISNVSLVFVVPVFIAAMRHGLAASSFAAILAVLSYNFFFLPPLYTFTIADPHNVVALFFLLFIAILASALASRLRTQTVRLRAEARRSADLYGFGRKLADVATLDDLLWVVVAQLARSLKVEVVVLMPERRGDPASRLQVRAAFPPEDEIDEADLAAARWSWDHETPTGAGTDTLPGGRRLFLPLGTAQGKVALLGVLPREQDGPLPPEQRRLLDALADQVAVAIEKMLLVEQVNEERVTAERERVRSAMLASVSHDLRTPLASIIGAISSLRTYGGYDEKAREELLATAQEEAERLNRFVGNLLDMTRLDAGAIAPRLEPVDVGDLVSTALRRATPLTAQHTVRTSVAPDLPPVQADFPLIEQALFNLIDNATKYAPAGTAIDVDAVRDGDAVEIRVRDEGPGIAEDALPHVFDKFFRAASGDRKRPGTGLGLAIARGFVEVQGGSIAASNRADRSGAAFSVRLKAAS